MRLALLILPALLSAQGPMMPGPGIGVSIPNNGYTWYGTYVVQAAQVTGTLSSFTVVAAGTIADFKTSGNGGQIQHTCTQALYSLTIPADLIFTSDRAGVNVLHWQFDTYDATTGAYSARVLMTNVDTSTNNTLYVFYKNSLVSTCQGGAASATWDASTVLAVTMSTNGFADYIGNTLTNHSAGSTTGINSGLSTYNDATPAYIDLGSSVSIKITGGTWEVWNNYTFSSSYGSPRLVSDASAAEVNGYDLMRSNSGNFFRLQVFNASASNLIQSSASYGAGTTYQVAVAYDSAGGTGTMWVNGAQDGTLASATNAIGAGATTPSIGREPGPNTGYFNGSIGPVIISNTVRAQAWIQARYNNEHAPNTFFTVTTGLVN